MNARPVRLLTPLVLWLVFAASLSAQVSRELTLETMNDPSLRQAFLVARTWWLADNTALVFDMRVAPESRTLERIDPTSGKKTPAFNYAEARKQFSALFPEGRSPSLPPVPQGITADGSRGFYLMNGDIFVVSLSDGSVQQITKTSEPEKSVNFSPDGMKLAYVRKNDVHVFDLERKRETRLTKDGSETILNGTLSWVYWEEIFGRQDIGYWWSHDSRTIAFLRTDEFGISVQHYVDITPWTPAVTTQRYPKVGEPNPQVRVGIVDISSGTTTWAGIEPSDYEYIIRVDWLPDSKRVCVRTLNRLQTELNFYFVDRANGKAQLVMKDLDEGWLNMSDDLYFLNDGKYFIISSERDGYAHLYRFTMDGKLINQITQGSWALASSGPTFWVRKAVSGIDEEGGWIYFTAQEKSHLEKHLYRIRLDGSGMERLTREDGTHGISMSSNTKFYFDRYSNITAAPSLTLVETGSGKGTVITQSDPSGLKIYSVQCPELFAIPARDGFMLPASITKPKDFDPKKKYPVIVYVYGGPSAPTVSNAFSFDIIWENILVNSGYVAMKVDNRGATGISKKLENLFLFQSPGSTELNDLVDAVQWMKKQSYVDPERFGIWGWSGGGTNTMMAMTRSKEFKAGIAGAGVTDFRFYDTKWAEAMMRTEKENKGGYESHSLLKDAKNLHGRLMLIHGTHDDNVHIQNTWRFVDKLVNANKLFELMVYPMRKHGVGDPAGRAHMNA
ncbi:MAG: S9 family peptidase, partial [Ignavibacteriales bacterium]|nr:S9 family peptidase [Ignavibacteriales bacterium]